MRCTGMMVGRSRPAIADGNYPGRVGCHVGRTVAGYLLRNGREFGTAPLQLQKRVNSSRMTKQQLIEKVAAKTEFGKAEVEVAVDSILELIAETLRSNYAGLAASW